jgi:hypothetical protein
MRVRLLINSLAVVAAFAIGATGVTAQQKKGHDHGGAGHKHNHPTAQAGGVLEDVGEYHVEMLVKDGKIVLTLRDHEAKDAATDGMKASVLLTAGSQRQGPIEIKPSGANKMEGVVAAVPAGAMAILTLTDKDGTAAQGRFKLK